MVRRCVVFALAGAAALYSVAASAQQASVSSTAPTAGQAINFGLDMIPPPADVTFGDVTFAGGAFLTANPDVYGGTAATPPGASDFWSIGVSGANGPVDVGSITFAGGASSLSFEWGSPDAYNTISFYDAKGNLLGSFTGTYVQAQDPGFSLGDQQVTRFFTFSSATDPIYTAVLTSPTNAFETADYRFISATPEPATWCMFGLGALGLVFTARRRKRGLQTALRLR